MRILISTGLFPNRVNPHRGVYILRQAVALRERAEVRVIAPVPYFPRFVRSSRYSHLGAVPHRDAIENIDVIYPRYVVAPRVFRAHHGLALACAMFVPFARIVRDFQPDAVITYFAFPYGYATVWIAKLLQVPVFTGVLGSDINVIGKSPVRRFMLRQCLNASVKVFSVSKALKDETVAIGVAPEKIVVIPNGIDGARFGRVNRSAARGLLGLGDCGRIVLSVANLVRIKGVDLLLRAFAHLEEPEYTLVVLGEGEQRRELEMLSGALGIASRVRFVGAKPPSEVPVWMAACDIVALASRAEGHPNVLVEALASGRPVVATRVGGVPEIVTSDRLGLVVEPEDARALGDAIRTALRREWDEETIRHAGLSRTWDDVAIEIMAELSPIVNARRDRKR